MNSTLKEIALMSGGILSVGSDSSLFIDNVVSDSRIARDGSLLVAIKGDKSDGHDFVANVISKLKAGALINKAYYESSLSSFKELPNLILVDDTIKALGLLAKRYRNTLTIPIVGITGSNGKTTVKEMLNSICESEFGVGNVLATEGNLNNHIGMPLTLLKIKPKHKVAIIEMGMNHSGELIYLSNIVKPNIATINNIMLAHAGNFNDLEDIAKAKGEIFSGLMDDGEAYINQSSPYQNLWQNHPGKNIFFGKPGSICYIKYNDTGSKFTLDGVLGEINCELKVLGEHNKLNAMTAATLAIALHCSAKNIQYGINNYTGYKGRLERKNAFNGALIIDDSYNANPDSVKAAILAIKDLPKPHWFVFADLAELGEFSKDSHAEVADFATKNGIECLLSYGEESKITYSVFKGAKMHFCCIEDIVKYCFEHLPASATLLVKGSNSMNLASFVSKIVK